MTDEQKYTNRLIREKSPYLLQHAHNPVDWYPWGDEAFEKARTDDKPIFLSIGYATCHWCHVMEKESFENIDIAKLLNENFVNIKVDREELPEIDLIYMEFAQSMMSGAAGWPLNVILTPQLQPFFAATYLPPYENHGLMGLTELIVRIRGVWDGEERENIIAQAEKIVDAFAESIHIVGHELPPKETIEETAELLLQLADPVYGGMKGEPKFPIGYQYNFLLREANISNDSRTVFLVERTLNMMCRGGIYDHLGGGFSRYSVDEKWLVPHFEKMLYDNALLAYAYLEAWQATKIPLYEHICQNICEYVLRDMMHLQGGFYSAEDADSEGKEGYFYTWTSDEIIQILGDQESEHLREFFAVTEQGNFEGRNILNTPILIDDFANQHQLDPDQFKKQINEQKQALLKVRNKRPRPFRDDKILSGWNGLMIHALAEAGKACNRQEFVDAAQNAAKFIYTNMWDGTTLFRRWRDGESSHSTGLEEYAYMIRGLISLFEVGCGVDWLRWAMVLADHLEGLFKESDGAFYQTDGIDKNIIIRKCQFADGAEPSGNAIHCENLVRLFQLTGNYHYKKQAEDILKAAKRLLENYSPGYCYQMISMMRLVDKKAPTIVLALNGDEDHLEDIMQLIYTHFIPHKAVVIRRQEDYALFETLEYVKEQVPVDGKTTLYICFQGVCEKPLNDFEEMVEFIQSL
jgi:uncharacterized protein